MAWRGGALPAICRLLIVVRHDITIVDINDFSGAEAGGNSYGNETLDVIRKMASGNSGNYKESWNQRLGGSLAVRLKLAEISGNSPAPR